MTARIHERSRAAEARELRALDDGDLEPPWLAPIARLNRTLGAMPLLPGNDAQLLPHAADHLPALVEAVRAARRYVHVEFYILSVDATTAPFFAALHDAVRRGVEVRVLLDHLGSRQYPGYRQTLAELDRIGVQWHLMLPVQPFRGRYQRPDLRNHRKLVVVDGVTGFVGSLNLIDPGYGKRSPPAPWPGVARRAGPPPGAGGARGRRPLRHRLVQRDGRAAAHLPGGPRGPSGERRPRAGRPGRDAAVPGGAERPGVRRRQQPRPVQLAHLQRRAPAEPHQPVRRAGRVPAHRPDDGGPAGRGRRDVRRRDGRPVGGVPRPALLLPDAARGRRAALPVPGPVDPARQAPDGRRRW